MNCVVYLIFIFSNKLGKGQFYHLIKAADLKSLKNMYMNIF